MSGELTIRRAVLADAPAGARFNIQCWREAYSELMTAEALAACTADEEAFTRRWTEQIVRGAPRYLALRDGTIVGYSLAGVDRDSGSDIPILYAIYVSATEYGRGVAQRLLDLSIGDGPATLWVFEKNYRARAFYARNGFVPVPGSERVEPQFGAPEIQMVRSAQVSG